VHKDTSINDGFKNIKLFTSQAMLSTETDDENSWFIDSGASAHRPVIKNGMINIMRKLMAHTFT
jgi:hypothetical protein